MSGRGFKDHFSSHAESYARSRPGYPPALFAHLAALAQSRHLAWDCATGNGQAAIGLAQHFERVVATDASAAQIEHGFPDDRIAYRVEPAEATSLESASVDLVTVGQAMHWFDLERFYAEAKRVLRPGGAIVAWCYGRCTIAPDIDAVVDRFYGEIVGPFWPAERTFVESGYRTLPFPFERVPMPAFSMHADWTAQELLAYLGTWSATKRFEAERGRNPRDEIAEPLANAWGSGARASAHTMAALVSGWTEHVMFTGIVEAVGRVRGIASATKGYRVTIDADGLDLSDVALGDSIAVNGCCLTVVEVAHGTLAMDVSQETIDCTAGLREGAAVNLERALRLSDRLGGHLVTGHVDGVGTVTDCAPEGESWRLIIEVPSSLARFVARKGSITINGVSLTVNEVSAGTFGVNLIPHTLAVTNLKDTAPGARVNLEVDLVARYVERLLAGSEEG